MYCVQRYSYSTGISGYVQKVPNPSALKIHFESYNASSLKKYGILIEASFSPGAIKPTL